MTYNQKTRAKQKCFCVNITITGELDAVRISAGKKLHFQARPIFGDAIDLFAFDVQNLIQTTKMSVNDVMSYCNVD